MKKIQTIFAPVLLGVTLLLGSCSDEPVPAPAPETEIGEGYVISSFNIDNGHYAIPEGVEKIEIALISTEGETLSYEAVYEPGEPSWCPSARPTAPASEVASWCLSPPTALWKWRCLCRLISSTETAPRILHI